MSDTGGIPHFCNDLGVTLIEVGSTEFMCIGAKPPFDHPHIYMDLGDDPEKVCPYCSTLYRYNPSLAPGAAKPEDSVWHGEDADDASRSAA